MQIIETQAEKINEMAAVMIHAASYVEEKEIHLEEIIMALKVENQVSIQNRKKLQADNMYDIINYEDSSLLSKKS